MSDETHESEHRPEDRPIHVHYLDKLPDPNLFPANVRFVPTPGCSTEPGGSIGSTATVHTEDGYQRHPASRLEQPRVGDMVERGQEIGRLGTDRFYQFIDQPFFSSWLDRHPGEKFDMGVDQQREFIASEAERRRLHLGPPSHWDPALVEVLKKSYEAGPKPEDQPASDQDEPRGEAIVYSEKLGDPADNGYDKGH